MASGQCFAQLLLAATLLLLLFEQSAQALGLSPAITSRLKRRESDTGGARRGQLETFSSESTGLGDLEALDALHNRMAKKWQRALMTRERRRRNQDNRLMKLLARRLGLSSLLAAPVALPRRRAFDANDDMGQEADKEQLALPGYIPNSRLSMLTTRKVEPSGLFLPRQSLTNTGQEMHTYDPAALMDAPQMNELEGAELGERLVMDELDSNYLPRIARKVRSPRFT